MQTTVDCCIVGGGPAGIVLGLLLARQHVNVCVLEAHADFNRDFRGDSVHPSTLEMLDQIGLVEQVVQIEPERITDFPVHLPDGSITDPSASPLDSKHPYTLHVPQAQLLDLLADHAASFPTFQLITSARVEALVYEGEVVRGVRYRRGDELNEVRAQLVVGADGRFSRVRQLAGIPLETSATPIDVLWLRLPRDASDPVRAHGIYPRVGRQLVLMARPHVWQIGYVFPKGGYQALRAAGIEALQAGIAEIVPWLSDRLPTLSDWSQTSMLSVQAGRVRRWYRPGLLLIGDAAHVMSPVAGVGINYAIQDAIVAANRLAGPLLLGRVGVSDLAWVQRRRELPTRLMQGMQAAMQTAVAQLGASASAGRRPWLMRVLERVAPIRELRTRLVAYGGFAPERVAALPSAAGKQTRLAA